MEATTRTGPFVIAVDAGGTHTRVGCFATDGSMLSTATGGGGTPLHNDDAVENGVRTLRDALDAGHLDPTTAVGLGVGISGASRVGSTQGDGFNDWVDDYFTMPSLSCPRVVVNDSVAAHRGAFLGEPGIIVVAGTGSMILAITDQGREIESGLLQHYAGGARHLVFDAMHLILSGATGDDDRRFVEDVLDYWGVDDVGALRYALLDLASLDRNETKRRFGRLAPLVTAAADSSPLADGALRHLVDKTALGVAVLAPLVGAVPVPGPGPGPVPVPVPVVTAGALATDPRFTTRLIAALAAQPGTPTRLVEPSLDPLRGAALLAYESAGIPVSRSVIENLRR